MLCGKTTSNSSVKHYLFLEACILKKGQHDETKGPYVTTKTLSCWFNTRFNNLCTRLQPKLIHFEIFIKGKNLKNPFVVVFL